MCIFVILKNYKNLFFRPACPGLRCGWHGRGSRDLGLCTEFGVCPGLVPVAQTLICLLLGGGEGVISIPLLLPSVSAS